MIVKSHNQEEWGIELDQVDYLLILSYQKYWFN